MESAEAVVQSCLFVSDVSCYDLTKDFSAPIIVVLVAFFTVKFAFQQIAAQHANSIEAQVEETKRNTRIELFKELSQTLDQSSSVVREVSSYCMVKKYSTMEMKAEINGAEYLTLMNNFGQSLLNVISKLESHEIVNFKLFRVFRFSLQSIHHDLMGLRSNADRFDVLERLIDLSNDAQCYFGDFQVCMQNMAYGEVFNTSVPHRVTVDKRHKVIVNDPKKLDRLLDYFSKETNWGKSCLKHEKEAVEKYHS